MSGYGDDLVLIFDGGSGDMLGQCYGPDGEGLCPEVLDPGDVVPCAGRRIAPSAVSTHRRWRLHVPAGTRTCPIAWMLEVED